MLMKLPSTKVIRYHILTVTPINMFMFFFFVKWDTVTFIIELKITQKYLQLTHNFLESIYFYIWENKPYGCMVHNLIHSIKIDVISYVNFFSFGHFLRKIIKFT